MTLDIDQIPIDLAVIGAGISGLATAVRAAELGRRVLVLEQGKADSYLCNSRLSGGITHLAFQPLDAEPEQIVAAMDVQTGGFIAPKLARALANDAKRGLQWMERHGARFVRRPGAAWLGRILAPPRSPQRGDAWKGRGPEVLLRKLTADLVALNGMIRFECRAKSLRPSTRGTHELLCGDGSAVLARCIVFADGGFQGDSELMQRFVSNRPEALQRRGAGTGRGDCLRMAQSAGAQLVGMSSFYGHLLSRDAMHTSDLTPYPLLDAIAAAAIAVDRSGRRFADEGLGGTYLANVLARRDDPLDAHVVYDASICDGVGERNLIPPAPEWYARWGGTRHEANSIAELALKMDVPPDMLSETVEVHNGAIRLGNKVGRQIPRTVSTYTPLPIQTPPFFAAPICAGVTYTMGGPAVDEWGRVLDASGSAIDGLFAVGCTAGGFEGGPHAGYVGGIAKGVITGMRCAEFIARSADQPVAGKAEPALLP